MAKDFNVFEAENWKVSRHPVLANAGVNDARTLLQLRNPQKKAAQKAA